MKRDIEINQRMLGLENMQRCQLSECHGACCLYGVWVGLGEKENILHHQDVIKKLMSSNFQNPDDWFERKIESDPFIEGGKVIHTKVIINKHHYGGTACVFLDEQHKCILQIASEVLGKHKWSLKPFYCILHPLDLDDEGKITLDDSEALLAEKGSCLRFSMESIPLSQTFEEELRYILGNEKYQKILNKNKDNHLD